MKYEEINNAVKTYINGNISDFKEHLKKCDKKDLLVTIEYFYHETGNDISVPFIFSKFKKLLE